MAVRETKRREYNDRRLLEADTDPDPLLQFEAWYREAVEAGLDLPNAMTLATAGAGGGPSARVVLLKELDDRGFVFYTNTESRKARELADNPRAALVFFWPQLDRQVRIDGTVERVARAQAEAYFRERPFESQVAAAVSDQSRSVPDRAYLEQRFAELKARCEAGGKVDVPAHWGGYRLCPEEVEFWQGGRYRLHDRILYRRQGTGWTRERLAP